MTDGSPGEQQQRPLLQLGAAQATPASPASPATTLRVLRILWAALLMGPLAFAIVVGAMIRGRQMGDPQPQTAQILMFLAMGFFLVGLPAGLFLRNQMYKRGWVEHSVNPGSYTTGNLVLFALMEGISFLGLMSALIGGTFLPYVLPSVLATAVHLLNFPTGKPMQAREHGRPASIDPQ